MANIPGSGGPSVVNNLHAPELFVDTCLGLLLQDGNIRFTFGSIRSDYHIGAQAQANLVVTARLVMPLPRAEELQKFLAQFIEDTKAGTLPPGSPRVLN